MKKQMVAFVSVTKCADVRKIPAAPHPGLSWQDKYSGCFKEQVNSISLRQILLGSGQERMCLRYRGQT